MAAVVFVGLTKQGPLPQLNLADGRILQIEAVTYGTKHRIGHRSIIYDHFGPWMPQKLKDWFAPKSPESSIELKRPGLVVWVNAIDPATGTNVDCQGIRVEFVDKHGDLFGQETSSWFGGQTFWRVGHIFYCYPRDEEQLTFRVTPWKRGKQTPGMTKLVNPRVSPAANWPATPPPQTKSVGALEITLARLNLRTNDANYWQTPSVYFDPVWEARLDGQFAPGWADPEWIAEDPTGNRGQFLCPHWPALKFFVTIYPTATNAAATLITALPKVDISALTNQTLWNSKFAAGTNEFVALGVCPPGVYTFTNGNFDPTGPRMGAVGGGAPSGWTRRTKRTNQLKLQTWHGHYTPSPTIYVRANLTDRDRIAVRLHDETGQLWTALPEPQGNPDGVHAFLLELPAGVTNVLPELVLLKPVQTEFLVKTPYRQ